MKFTILVAFMLVAAARFASYGASSAPGPRDIILIQSEQDGDMQVVFSCTRSSGAPLCRVGDNTAQVVADLLAAGFRPDPEMGTALMGYGVYLTRP